MEPCGSSTSCVVLSLYDVLDWEHPQPRVGRIALEHLVASDVEPEHADFYPHEISDGIIVAPDLILVYQFIVQEQQGILITDRRRNRVQ